MADAYSLEAKWDGVDPGTRKPYGYRQVDLDRVFVIGDGPANGDPDVEANAPTPSAFDHITKMARVITKRFLYRGKRLDVAEMLAMVLTRLDELEAKLESK